jgi:carotenoid cleavage dioxygenase-like enzyme
MFRTQTKEFAILTIGSTEGEIPVEEKKYLVRNTPEEVEHLQWV